MPDIKRLVKLISDDVSINMAQWVLAGQTSTGYPAKNSFGSCAPLAQVASVSAIGVSPMQVQTAAPHNLSTGQWIVIFGAIGHNSPNWSPANNTDPPSFQHSINGAWQVTVIDATHFSVADGVTPGVSNGYWVSGGTVCSSPLIDGRIAFGAQHIAEGLAPPRIIFALPRSEWPGKGMYDPSTANPQDDLGTQKLARSLWTELYVFEVHVWGQYVDTVAGVAGDPEGEDKNVAQQIYQQVIRSLDQMARGTWDISPGRFTAEQTAVINKMGEEFVFFLKIGSPIPEVFLEFAPPGTSLRQPTFSPNPQTG